MIYHSTNLYAEQINLIRGHQWDCLWCRLLEVGVRSDPLSSGIEPLKSGRDTYVGLLRYIFMIHFCNVLTKVILLHL